MGRLLATLALALALAPGAPALAAPLAPADSVGLLLETARTDGTVEVAASLHRLAVELRAEGRPVEAMKAFRGALELRERLLGRDHLDVAATLTELAVLEHDLGDYRASGEHSGRSVRIRERALGPDHPDVATSLMRQANAIERAGDPAAAVPLHERALAIRERALGPWNRGVAQALNNFALALMGTGQLDRARGMLERSIAIRDSLLGPGSEEAARPRLRLGLLHLRAGNPASAEKVLREAVDANERAFGEKNALSADPMIAHGCALLRLGRDTEALDVALEAERRTLEQLRLIAQGLDETQALIYSASRSSGLQVALTVAAAHPADSAIVARAWDGLARSRAVVLDEMVARRRWARASDDTVTRGMLDRIAATRDRLARLALEGAGTDSAGRAEFASAVAEKRAAEQALADRSLEYRGELAGAATGYTEFSRALPPRSALVTYAWSEILPRTAAGDTALGVMAFVTTPDAAPRVVLLGAVREIDAAIHRWLATLQRPPDALRRARDEAACRAAGQALRARVWDPIAPLVAGAERVFVVTEAGLQVAPLAALPDAAGRTLVERGPLLQTLATERDLVSRPSAAGTAHGMLVVGGPAFDRAGASRGAARAAGNDPCAVLEGGRFEALPNAGVEAADVARAWDAVAARPRERAVVLRGAGASERAVRTGARGRRALHVASHGFFLPETCAVVAGGEGTPAVARHPLLRGGLALAGANQRRPDDPPDDDGILTAEEIAGLDLTGLEWVVLSACETGLGTFDINEGMLGLRRAFRAAGAHALVMSLWRVDDEATREWMRALYRARTSQRDGPAAIRAASRAVLEARRASGRSLHPYYWAAFVCEGVEPATRH